MARGEIITTIKDGKATVTVRGIKGKACKEVTAELEKALGRKISDRPTRELTEQPECLRQKQ